MLSPKFSKKFSSKRGEKLSRNRGGNDKSSKRLNMLLAVTAPTVSNPSQMADVVTSEDVLKEENAKTVSRKTIISRPIDQSPSELEEVLTSARKQSVTQDEPVTPSESNVRIERRFSTKSLTPIRTFKKTSDATKWTVGKHERRIQVGTPVLGISSNNNTEFVTTTMDGVIRVYDVISGELLSSLQLPVGVDNRQKFQAAMTKQGDFVVASGNAVTLWSDQGRLMHEYGKQEFRFCKHLHLNEDGLAAVTDSDRNCAVIMSLDGNWFHKFGDKDDLKCPTGVTILSNGDIAVADWKSTIQLFDRHGRYKFEFGQKGKLDCDLDLPYGLTCDGQDNILVADWWNNRVSVFDRSGNFVKHLLTAENGIKMPAYICVPYQGNQLILSEFGSREIKVFYF